MSAAAAPAPKAKRRRWVRVLRTLLFLFLLLVLLLSGTLWWVYSRRVMLVNNALEDIGPMRSTVGSFDVTRSGGLEMRDLVFTDRVTGTVVARVPHASARPNLSRLPPNQIT